jgi:hypothetical protein
MGGYSYHFLTGAINCLTRNLGSSFASAFDMQYYDPKSNTVKDLRFFPELFNEEVRQSDITPKGVGGEVAGINKLNLVVPWLALAFVITVSGVSLRLRRRKEG